MSGAMVTGTILSLVPPYALLGLWTPSFAKIGIPKKTGVDVRAARHGLTLAGGSFLSTSLLLFTVQNFVFREMWDIAIWTLLFMIIMTSKFEQIGDNKWNGNYSYILFLHVLCLVVAILLGVGAGFQYLSFAINADATILYQINMQTDYHMFLPMVLVFFSLGWVALLTRDLVVITMYVPKFLRSKTTGFDDL